MRKSAKKWTSVTTLSEEVLGREKMLLLKDLLAELAKIEDALNS